MSLNSRTPPRPAHMRQRQDGSATRGGGACRARLFADAPLAVAAMTGEVEMEMVAVMGVVGRAEHGGENVASPAMHRAQERAVGKMAPPAALDVDHASVGQHEGRDVDGIGMAVLG